MKWSPAAGLALTLVLACGSQSPAAPTQQVAAGSVYVKSEVAGAMRVIDSATGRVERTLPMGTPSPDWRVLYRLSASALDLLDPLSGRVLESHPAPEWAQAMRTSADGRWLVLTRSGPDGRFQVQDAAFARRPVDVSLPGRFTFDGISGDGQRLYLLEWVSADRYQVRMYDLGRGALSPVVITEKGEEGQLMSGAGGASSTTRDGALQLTLYQRSAKGLAFVHALPLSGAFPFAFCIDLPAPAEGWGLVAAPDGRRFYAVNPLTAEVVELTARAEQPPTTRQRRIDTRSAAIRLIVEAAAKEPGGPVAAAVSPDGSTLYVGLERGLVAIDTRTLTTRAHGLEAQRVTSLAVAPGGGAVYAVGGFARLLRLDPRSLAVASDVLVGQLDGILRAT